MSKSIFIILIFISFGFTNEKLLKEDEINAIYSTEPIGHAYGYYLFEGNKVGRYIRNVGTFYREGNYIINKNDSTIRITYTKAAFSREPFKKGDNKFNNEKYEILTYSTIEIDGNYIINGLDLVKEKDKYSTKSDINDIRRSSNIKKTIK